MSLRGDRNDSLLSDNSDDVDDDDINLADNEDPTDLLTDEEIGQLQHENVTVTSKIDNGDDDDEEQEEKRVIEGVWRRHHTVSRDNNNDELGPEYSQYEFYCPFAECEERKGGEVLSSTQPCYALSSFVRHLRTVSHGKRQVLRLDVYKGPKTCKSRVESFDVKLPGYRKGTPVRIGGCFNYESHRYEYDCPLQHCTVSGKPFQTILKHVKTRHALENAEPPKGFEKTAIIIDEETKLAVCQATYTVLRGKDELFEHCTACIHCNKLDRNNVLKADIDKVSADAEGTILQTPFSVTHISGVKRVLLWQCNTCEHEGSLTFEPKYLVMQKHHLEAHGMNPEDGVHLKQIPGMGFFYFEDETPHFLPAKTDQQPSEHEEKQKEQELIESMVIMEDENDSHQALDADGDVVVTDQSPEEEEHLPDSYTGDKIKSRIKALLNDENLDPQIIPLRLNYNYHREELAKLATETKETYHNIHRRYRRYITSDQIDRILYRTGFSYSAAHKYLSNIEQGIDSASWKKNPDLWTESDIQTLERAIYYGIQPAQEIYKLYGKHTVTRQSGIICLYGSSA